MAVAAERFFELGEAVPGVVFVVVGGGAVKIEIFEAFVFCIKNHGCDHGGDGRGIAKLVIGAGVHIVASFGVVHDEACGYGFSFIFCDIEG